MFQTKIVGKIETKILFSKHYFRKSCCLWDNVEKLERARQATNGNIMLLTKDAFCILDN